MRVCRSCHRPAPGRLKPGQGFICTCFVPEPNCRREAARKQRAKRRLAPREEENYAYV